ncbi:MAG TPA: hypothetical protein VKU87_04190, partial [Thermomicrobiaceae bacterium]|nr:hypothetical protein [Thermomicrobiaceae bacterium]
MAVSNAARQAADQTIPSQMKAVVLTGPNAHEVREVPTPHPGPMEVLCQVDSTAICGTDLHI